MGDKLPRGIRNNNPSNIDYNPNTKWAGLDDPPTDGRFCRFISPEYGIRAMTKTLLTYQRSHGLNTVRGIINRWAPPIENNTDAYVNAVAKAVAVSPDSHIDLDVYTIIRPLVEAIIHHENGQQPYSDKEIDEGLHRAGIQTGRA